LAYGRRNWRPDLIFNEKRHTSGVFTALD